jgi:hypothetical protein
MRHGVIGPDATEPPPAERVGHLYAQRLEAEAVAEPQVHETEIGLDRDRRPPVARVEVRCERFEEDRVVKQAIDRTKPRRETAKLLWQQ